MPQLVGVHAAGWGRTGDIHTLVAEYDILPLVGLHVAAALYHYFIRRDRVLQRMLASQIRRQEPLSERHAQQQHGFPMIGFVKVIIGNVPHHHLPVMSLPPERADKFIRRAERIRLAIGQCALESEKSVAPQV